MSDISDAGILEALRRTMSLAAAKQVVSASNLANVNTPGYRAREVSFADTLDERMGLTLSVTHRAHFEGGAASPLQSTREVPGLAARRDGNTVQIDRELLALARAGGEFARAQTALAAKFRLIRYAISETR